MEFEVPGSSKCYLKTKNNNGGFQGAMHCAKHIRIIYVNLKIKPKKYVHLIKRWYELTNSNLVKI